MAKVKVAINGFGTIGKRVADAIQMQKDVKIVGTSKTKPDLEAFTILNEVYFQYTPAGKLRDTEQVGIPATSTIEDLVVAVYMMIEPVPGKLRNVKKAKYKKAGTNAVWQDSGVHRVMSYLFDCQLWRTG